MTRAASAPALTHSIQDYLKCIYEITSGGEPAPTNAIATRLKIAPASVTGMLQKMAAARPALVDYKKHQGVRLTSRGERAALEVIRHHRLIETWLVKTLGYSWDEVHTEAEKLEHAMSEDLEKRIAEALGNPIRDPHGEPIPTADLVMPVDHSVPLAELKTGRTAIVRRVHPDDQQALRHLTQLGISIGARLQVIGVSPIDDVITVRVEGRPSSAPLGPALTRHVYVESGDRIEEGKK